MTKLTTEQAKKLFGEHKDSIVIEQYTNAEITQEPSNDLATLTINLVAPDQLMDVGNIPTLDYIKDKNQEVKSNADVIMANYHNRSIEQIHLVDDAISNRYSSVESAVLWLEVINSNLNQLMGLASVNNYLLGMMGVGGAIIQNEELMNIISQNFNGESSKSDIDTLVEAVGFIGSGFSIGGVYGGVLSIVVYTMIKTIPEELPNGQNPSSYLKGGGGYSSDEGGSNYPANRNYKPPTEEAEDYDSKIMRKKQLNTPLEANEIVYSQPLLLISGVEDEASKIMRKKQMNTPLEANEIVYFQSSLAILGVEDETSESTRKKQMNTPLETNASVNTQPLVAISDVKDEIIFTADPSFFSILFEGLINIFGLDLDTAHAAELSPNMSNPNVRNEPNNTYKNKTNTTTSASEDLQNSMYNERNYAPQKIEHTYDIPITNYITVNEAEKNDYDEFARKIKREIVNEILGLKAVMV